MYVIRVIPLVSLPPSVPQILDYYWIAPLPRGAIVRAPLGRRQVQAVVIDSTELARSKMALRNAGFQVRRLASIVHAEPHVNGVQLSMAKWLSDTYFSGPATCLRTACQVQLPVVLGSDSARTMPVRVSYRISSPTSTVLFLRGIARAATEPVLILVPDAQTVVALGYRLSSLKPLMVHHTLGRHALREAHRMVSWGAARVVIGTKSALFMPWSRLAHIVVEDPANDAYKHDRSPRYSAPDVARELATLTSAHLTLLAPSPLVTAEHLARTGKLKRVLQREPATVVPAPIEASRGFGIFTPKAARAFDMAAQGRRSVLVFSARKGYASSAACTRCRVSPQCAICSLPLRYWRTGSDVMLVCYRCGAFRNMPPRCPACGRGVLRQRGFVGSQRLAEAVAARLNVPWSSIPILDADLTRSRSDADRIWGQFDSMERPVMVATSLVFGERYRRTFDTVIVPDVDALATNPDFRTTERTLATIQKLADFSPNSLVLQHRMQDSLVESVAMHRWGALMDAEIADRRSFGWPPFARLALLRASHRDRAAAHRLARLTVDRAERAIAYLKLAPLITISGPSPSWIPRIRGVWTEQVLIASRAPHDRLRALLSHLPKDITVDIDPQSIA